VSAPKTIATVFLHENWKDPDQFVRFAAAIKTAEALGHHVEVEILRQSDAVHSMIAVATLPNATPAPESA
jgi:hypothetical protein